MFKFAIIFQEDDSDKMYRNIVRNIIDHETNYVEWLNVFLKVSSY